jgi:alanine dehydrogenase
MEENEALRKGLNLIDGKVVCQAVAESFGLAFIQNPFSPGASPINPLLP